MIALKKKETNVWIEVLGWERRTEPTIGVQQRQASSVP